MVFLGFVEVLQRFVFHHDGQAVFFLLARKGLVDNGFFGRVGVVHAGAVLDASIVALFVEAGGVDHAEIVLQDVVEAEFVGIVGNAHGFGVAAVVDHILIAGVFRAAVGIAGYGIGHAVDTLEIGFQAPEAAACEIDGFGVHRFHFRFVLCVELCFQTAYVGFGVADQGQSLRFVDAAFDDAGDVAAFVEHRPRGVNADIQAFGNRAARIHRHRQLGIVEAGIPFLEVAVFFLAEKTGRGHGNQVGRAETLVGRPFFGVPEFGQAQRTPARPKFHQRGFAVVQTGHRFAVCVFQLREHLGDGGGLRLGRVRDEQRRAGGGRHGDEGGFPKLAHVFSLWDGLRCLLDARGGETLQAV